MVGARGFEPPTSATPLQRASQAAPRPDGSEPRSIASACDSLKTVTRRLARSSIRCNAAACLAGLAEPDCACTAAVVAAQSDEKVHLALDLQVNGKRISVLVDPTTPLLWVLREELGLTGTKYGCGAAQCGACTVHVDGVAMRSCVLPASAVEGKRITTIEGLATDLANPLINAWIETDVPQCGYCQSGQIMSASILLAERTDPTDEEIDACMAGNVCRCATYVRIRSAIHRAAALKRGVK